MRIRTKEYESIVCRVCNVCGKKFVPAPQHVYRDRRVTHPMVCSWACVCESERLKMAGIKIQPKKGERSS